MNIIYYRQQTSKARDPAPIEFDEDFATTEMLRYIFEDFIKPDNYQPYYTIPENFKKTYLKTENKAEFLKILKKAMNKIKKMTFQELNLPSPTPKGKEILESVKSLHPNLDIEEVKGTVRTRLLEEPADIDSSISSVSGFLNARELNRYLEQLEKHAVNIEEEATGKDKEKITITIKETNANLADLKSNDEDVDLSGVENIKRLSEIKEVHSKIVKVFTLGFTDAKLADKPKATLDLLANTNPSSPIKEEKIKRKILEKEFAPVYTSYLREKNELVTIETMLTLLAAIKTNETLYDRVYERFKNSPDALYQLSEDYSEVLGDENLKEISEMFYTLSADAKEYFTTKDEQGEIIIGDVRELMRTLQDSDVLIKPDKPNIVKPLQDAVTTYKEYKKETNKTESINKKAMKKLTDFIKELKEMVYNQDAKVFDKFEFTPEFYTKKTKKDKKGKPTKEKIPVKGKLKGKSTITLGELIRNPDLVSVEGTNKAIKNIEKELDELDIKLDKLENQKFLTEAEEKDKDSLKSRIKLLLSRLESYEKFNISDVFRRVGYLDDDGYTMEFLDDIRKMFDEDIEETKKEFLTVFENMQDILLSKGFAQNSETMDKLDFLDLLKENFMTKRKETNISAYKKELNSVKKIYSSSISTKKLMIDAFLEEKEKQIDSYTGTPAIEREKQKEQRFDLAHKQAKKYYDAAKENNAGKILELVKKSPIKDSLKQINLLHTITIIINKGMGLDKNDNPKPTYEISSFRLQVDKEIETRLLPSAIGKEGEYKPKPRTKLGMTKFKTAKKGDYAIFLDSISAAIPDLQKAIRRLR